MQVTDHQEPLSQTAIQDAVWFRQAVMHLLAMLPSCHACMHKKQQASRPDVEQADNIHCWFCILAAGILVLSVERVQPHNISLAMLSESAPLAPAGRGLTHDHTDNQNRSGHGQCRIGHGQCVLGLTFIAAMSVFCPSPAA